MSTLKDDPGRDMARLQAGDWWEYAVEGSATREGRTMGLRGEIRVSVERREAGGRMRDALVFAPDHRIVGIDGPAGRFPMPAGVFYIEQEAATNAVLIAGDNMGPGGADRFAVAPQVFYPGTFDADTAYDNVLDFGPHGRVANSLRTVGTEIVDTALGHVIAWKASIRSSSEQFGNVEGCDWWRPALGAPVRFEMTATGPDGSRLQTAALLRATSRALA